MYNAVIVDHRATTTGLVVGVRPPQRLSRTSHIFCLPFLSNVQVKDFTDSDAGHAAAGRFPEGQKRRTLCYRQSI
jgi:hypothetical protein